MKVSQKGLEFIQKHEGLKFQSYRDSASIPTIGYGTTRYENGDPVLMGQVIDKERADALLAYWVGVFAEGVDKLVDVQLTQNQYDAIVAFAYNIGLGGFKTSSVLKRLNKNPNDPAIRDAFMLWNKATVNGKKVPITGLTNRRRAEADLYFS